MLIPKTFWARFAAIAVLGVSLAACSGDDGKEGPEGPTGPAGPSGPTGPAGPSSGVPIDSAELINIEVVNVTVPAGGGAPVVELTLANDLTQGLFGLPAGDIRFVLSQLSPGSSGASSEWQSYVTRDSGGITDAQATAGESQGAAFAPAEAVRRARSFVAEHVPDRVRDAMIIEIEVDSLDQLANVLPAGPDIVLRRRAPGWLSRLRRCRQAGLGPTHGEYLLLRAR